MSDYHHCGVVGGGHTDVAVCTTVLATLDLTSCSINIQYRSTRAGRANYVNCGHKDAISDTGRTRGCPVIHGQKRNIIHASFSPGDLLCPARRPVTQLSSEQQPAVTVFAI